MAWTVNTTFHASATLPAYRKVNTAAMDVDTPNADLGVAIITISYPTVPQRGYVRVTPLAGVVNTTTLYAFPDEAYEVEAAQIGDVVVIKHIFQEPFVAFEIDNQTEQDATVVGIWACRVPA